MSGNAGNVAVERSGSRVRGFVIQPRNDDDQPVDDLGEAGNALLECLEGWGLDPPSGDSRTRAWLLSEVWGTRTYDESAMFEALTLGVFEVGLSWSIVFGKRDAFRRAFRGFDVAKVAAMTDRDVDRLVQDASIIRNRSKIQATVDNARAMMSASPSLVALAKSYEITRKRAPRSSPTYPSPLRRRRRSRSS